MKAFTVPARNDIETDVTVIETGHIFSEHGIQYIAIYPNHTCEMLCSVPLPDDITEEEKLDEALEYAIKEWKKKKNG
jgi:hypothetical protein